MMPHLVIQYSAELESELDFKALCTSLAATVIGLRDEAGAPPFPIGGTRVLAYPAAHGAVADGQHDCAFAYFNLRIARGRSEAVKKAAGEALAATIRRHFAPLLARRNVGLTLQIDEGAEVFDAKLGNLHSLYARP
jgi:5-carboxymethyl-2-hydroxymuconate isomerase